MNLSAVLHTEGVNGPRFETKREVVRLTYSGDNFGSKRITRLISVVASWYDVVY